MEARYLRSRHPILIVAIVAGLSLLETSLLLTFAVPGQPSTPDARQLWSILLGYLLIPGTAATFLVFFHGTERWIRSLTLTTAVPLGVAVIVIPLLGWVEQVTSGVVLLVLTLASAGVIVTLLWERSRRKSLELDTADWLAWRRSHSLADARRVSIALNVALWFPSLAVLLVLLFLPESYAIASHLVYPGTSRVGAYEATIPLEWAVTGRYDNYVHGFAGNGIARNLGSVGVPIAHWYIWAKRNGAGTCLGAEVDRRSFQIGHTTLVCLAYRPTLSDGYVNVDCTSPVGLGAAMDWGQPNDVSSFYKTISNVKELPRATWP